MLKYFVHINFVQGRMFVFKMSCYLFVISYLFSMSFFYLYFQYFVTVYLSSFILRYYCSILFFQLLFYFSFSLLLLLGPRPIIQFGTRVQAHFQFVLWAHLTNPQGPLGPFSFLPKNGQAQWLQPSNSSKPTVPSPCRPRPTLPCCQASRSTFFPGWFHAARQIGRAHV